MANLILGCCHNLRHNALCTFGIRGGQWDVMTLKSSSRDFGYGQRAADSMDEYHLSIRC